MELWEIVDENGVGTGKFCKRSERDAIPDGYCHLVVETWVTIGDRVLLTQRHPDKWAGLQWETAGGAALAGESAVEGAVRELAEETGILVGVDDLSYLGATKRGKSLIFSFVTHLDVTPEISLQPTEVVDHKIVTPDQLDSLSQDLTEGTRERWALYRERIVSQN